MNGPIDKKQWIAMFSSLKENTMLSALAMELLAIEEDTIKLRMPITDKVRQPARMLHGGASMALAESAASIHASFGIDLSKVIPVTIEINGSHIQSARDGSVIADGRVIERRWESLIMHQVDILHEETGTLLSSVRVTNYFKPVTDHSAAAEKSG